MITKYIHPFETDRYMIYLSFIGVYDVYQMRISRSVKPKKEEKKLNNNNVATSNQLTLNVK